ncbi:MAG: ATP-binding cassette domain-containing protein [Promethearchaeia archaeon]
MSIDIFGNPLTRSKNDLWEIRKQIGFLFQNPDNQLFAPTIKEDVGFGARNLGCSDKEVEKRVKWALSAVNILEHQNRSPFNLSWGQKKTSCACGIIGNETEITYFGRAVC